VDKYLNYRSLGQKGWDLDRLIDEKTLTVERVPENILPKWFNPKDTENPKDKKLIIDLYKNEI